MSENVIFELQEEIDRELASSYRDGNSCPQFTPASTVMQQPVMPAAGQSKFNRNVFPGKQGSHSTWITLKKKYTLGKPGRTMEFCNF